MDNKYQQNSTTEQLIISKIENELKNNHNYPMIKKIELQKLSEEEAMKYGEDAIIYKVKIILYEHFEHIQTLKTLKYQGNIMFGGKVERTYSPIFSSFKNLCDEYEFFLYLDKEYKKDAIEREIRKNIIDLGDFLYNCQIKEYPLYIPTEITKEQINKNLDYYSHQLFHTPYKELDKKQRSIVFGIFNKKKFQTGREIVEDIKKFIEKKGRFPFKTEDLFKAYVYAKQICFLTDDEIDEIESLRREKYSEYRHDLYNKLIEFIQKNQRFPYETENEFKLWYDVGRYYKFNSYTADQVAKYDCLYARYNNDNDSEGERLINTYLTYLGYKIEKQKTFPGLIYKKQLKFDTCIYIDDLPCLIEFDGVQHFQPIKYFGGEEGFKKTKIRDQIKNEYCEQNNIPLLRIKYTELAELENIIDEFINSIKKRHTK